MPDVYSPPPTTPPPTAAPPLPSAVDANAQAQAALAASRGAGPSGTIYGGGPALPRNPSGYATTPLPIVSSPHDPSLNPYLATGTYRQGAMASIASPYLPSEYNALQNAGNYGAAALTSVLADPYSMPASIKTGYLQSADRAYQAAANRQRAAGFASGQNGGGVNTAAMGNVEMSRGQGMADAERALAEIQTKLGDSRITSMYLPLMKQLSDMFDSAYGKAVNPKTKKTKADWLKVVGGALVATVGGYYTGGALVGPGLAIAESGLPHNVTTYDTGQGQAGAPGGQ